MDDIDGFLVGGASLKGDDFVTICNSAKFSARVKA
jgi:triosephosphate isomerase